MAISRSLMNRQLRADGGIMQVAPREKFGLGSKLKKFVRKIIPNEVADIAVKAAPFVAPFNPAVAAAMSGLGTFDQTGSIGKSLKGAGMNYAGGQAARYLGGAGFQGNPFGDGGAFTGSGFTSGFSSPLGSDTGLGKFFSNRGTEGVQGIDMATGGADGVGVIQDAPTKALASELSYVPEASIDMVTGGADGVGIIQDSFINKTTVENDPGFLKNLFDGISNQDYGKVGNTILDGAKKFGKAMFTNKDGSIDKAAVMGAITFATSYAEALALANDAGVELTEEEYNEARKDEKKAEYAGYLTNFFAGKKDGGRIGFESGANEMIKTQLLEEIMPDTSTEDMIMIMTEDGPKMIKRSDFEAMPGMFRDTTTSAYGDAGRGRPVPEFAKGGRIGFSNGTGGKTLFGDIAEIDIGKSLKDSSKSLINMFSPSEIMRILSEAGEGFKQIYFNLKSDSEKENLLKTIMGDGYEQKANGGRIGFKFGTKPKQAEIGIMSIDVESGDDEDEEDMMMAGITFSRPEKSYLFRRLGGSGGADRSYTMPNLYRILNNPNKYPEDAAILKEIAIMGLGEGQKDGGRIGYKKGANRVSELLILRDGILAKDANADVSDIEAEIFQLTGKTFKSVGGISDVPTGKIRKNNAGVVERDYRDEGGFVPVGIKERADDVPAMLSKNEFVMTADAVRGIGNGSVEEGSKKLYNTMKKAEQVGKA